jgi:hypothetical protein
LCGRRPRNHPDGDHGGHPPGQAAGPCGEPSGPPAPVLSVGGGAGAADAGPDPHRHHRRRPTGPEDVVLVLVVVEVAEQGGQVGLAEGRIDTPGWSSSQDDQQPSGPGSGCRGWGLAMAVSLWC